MLLITLQMYNIIDSKFILTSGGILDLENLLLADTYHAQGDKTGASVRVCNICKQREGKKQSPVSRKMCLLTYVENLKSSVELSLRDRLLLLVVDILFFREQKFFLLFLFF